MLYLVVWETKKYVKSCNEEKFKWVTLYKVVELMDKIKINFVLSN